MSGSNVPPALTVAANGNGVVTDQQLNTYVQGGALLANLRAFPGLSKMCVWMLGTDVPNDGGEGMFYWNGTATANDDSGVTTIAPNGLATGRWLRQSGADIFIASVANIAALRALTTGASPVWVEGYYAAGDGGEGMFYLGGAGSDNGGTIIVSSAGTYYRETGGEPLSVKWFGATGNGTTNDTAAIQATAAAGTGMYIPAGSYLVTASTVLQTGATVSGAGAGDTTILVDFGGYAFQNVQTATKIVNIVIEGLTFSGQNIGAGSVYFVLTDTVTVRNCVFAGMHFNVVADRGWRFLCEDCTSTGNALFQSGQIYMWSSVDEIGDTLQYIFSPRLLNYYVNTGAFDSGVIQGSATPAIYVRRSAGAVLQDCNIDHGEIGNAPPTFIQIENDNQGMNIIGGSSHGCAIGILIQPGSGIAAVGSYIDIINHSIDFFSFSGIQVAATSVASTQCGIYGGAITGATGSAVPYIDLANCIDWVISGVRITDYSGNKNGIGLLLNSVVTVTMSNTIIDSVNVGWDINSGAQECYFVNNVVKNCTTQMSGSFANALCRVVGNYGINPLAVTTPSMPASNAGPLANNTGTDVMIYVNGGSNVGAVVNSVEVPSNPGPFFVPAQGSINITYDSAPVWFWVGC